MTELLAIPEGPAYIYSPLQVPIRLFEVISIPGGSYVYDLIHTTVENAPPFQAVSYAWGTSVRTHYITLIDGTRLPITKNLFEAIPHLSRFAHSGQRFGYLWIDQICINQDHIPERNYQVKHMGHIYKNCKNTLIWLTETEDLDPKTKEFFDFAAGDESNADFQKRIPSIDVPSSDIAWQRILQLFRRPWFSRAWVLQEAVLPNLCFTILGSDLITLKALCRGLSYFLDVYSNQIENPDLGVQSLYDAWINKQLESIQIPYHEVLTMLNQDSTATDERDLVYAYLGMKREDAIEIDPNYADTIENTYINAATSIIRGSKSLDFFRTLCRHGQYPSNSVPSWVADWRTEVKRWMVYETQHLLSPERKPKACQGREHVWKSLNDPHHLAVRGKRIDVVKWVVSPGFSMYTLATEELDLCDYLHLDETFDLIQLLVEPLDTTITRARLLRTLIGNAMYENLPGVELVARPGMDLQDIDAMLSAYDHFKTSKPPPLQEPATLEQAYMRALQVLCRIVDNRCIFVSAAGKIGLASRAQEGDYISILHGSTTPVLLRPHSDDTYLVLEDCYFEDVMYGEAVSWKEEEADEFILA